MISVHFQGNPFNITVIKIYEPNSNAEEAEVEQLYKDLPDLLIPEEGFLISPCYSLELCTQMGIPFLFPFAFHFSSFQSYL